MALGCRWRRRVIGERNCRLLDERLRSVARRRVMAGSGSRWPWVAGGGAVLLGHAIAERLTL